MKQWSFEKEDGSYFLKSLVTFALVGIAFAAVWIAIDVHEASTYRQPSEPAPATYTSQPTARPAPVYVPPPPPPKPIEFTRTLAFMPGQYTNFKNQKFRKIEIHSTFPIRVVSGSCHVDYGVEFICNSDPSDLFITDMRPKPIFRTPQANDITITAAEF